MARTPGTHSRGVWTRSTSCSRTGTSRCSSTGRRPAPSAAAASPLWAPPALAPPPPSAAPPARRPPSAPGRRPRCPARECLDSPTQVSPPTSEPLGAGDTPGDGPARTAVRRAAYPPRCRRLALARAHAGRLSAVCRADAELLCEFGSMTLALSEKRDILSYFRESVTSCHTLGKA